MSNSTVQAIARKEGEKLADYIPRLGSTTLEFQPGSRWAYSAQAGHDTLGRIVEIAPRISEDWLSLIIGLFIFVLALAGIANVDLLGWVVTTSVWNDVGKALGTVSKSYASLGGFGALIATYVALLVVLSAAAVALKSDLKKFALAFTAVFWIAYASWVIGNFANFAAVTPADLQKFGLSWSLRLTNEGAYIFALIAGLVIVVSTMKPRGREDKREVGAPQRSAVDEDRPGRRAAAGVLPTAESQGRIEGAAGTHRLSHEVLGAHQLDALPEQPPDGPLLGLVGRPVPRRAGPDRLDIPCPETRTLEGDAHRALGAPTFAIEAADTASVGGDAEAEHLAIDARAAARSV
jgi:hypothetical protein